MMVFAVILLLIFSFSSRKTVSIVVLFPQIPAPFVSKKKNIILFLYCYVCIISKSVQKQ